MRDLHEPQDDFVERLQWQIRTEVRQRQRAAAIERTPARPRWRLAAAAIGLAAVSMFAGGAAVVVAYQAQATEQGTQLAVRYEQRADLEKQKLALAKSRVTESERRAQMGIAPAVEVLEERTKLADLEGKVELLMLNVQEVRASGREVTDGVTAPLVSGRDFVSERWRIEQRSLTATLEYEKALLDATTRRFAVGLVGQDTVVEAQARVNELQAAAVRFESRLALRQRFLKKEIDTAEAELRMLEGEAQLRQKTLQAKLGPAREDVERVNRLFNVGLTSRLQIAEAQLKLHEIETELAKAGVDLALIQAKLAERRGK